MERARDAKGHFEPVVGRPGRDRRALRAARRDPARDRVGRGADHRPVTSADRGSARPTVPPPRRRGARRGRAPRRRCGRRSTGATTCSRRRSRRCSSASRCSRARAPSKRPKPCAVAARSRRTTCWTRVEPGRPVAGRGRHRRSDPATDCSRRSASTPSSAWIPMTWPKRARPPRRRTSSVPGACRVTALSERRTVGVGAAGRTRDRERHASPSAGCSSVSGPTMSPPLCVRRQRTRCSPYSAVATVFDKAEEALAVARRYDSEQLSLRGSLSLAGRQCNCGDFNRAEARCVEAEQLCSDPDDTHDGRGHADPNAHRNRSPRHRDCERAGAAQGRLGPSERRPLRPVRCTSKGLAAQQATLVSACGCRRSTRGRRLRLRAPTTTSLRFPARVLRARARGARRRSGGGEATTRRGRVGVGAVSRPTGERHRPQRSGPSWPPTSTTRCSRCSLCDRACRQFIPG